MKRKVVKHGPSTLIVSIPSGWAKRNKVVKGGEVDVKEDGKLLVVSAESPDNSKLREISIDVTDLDRTSLIFVIRSLYRVGYDSISLKFEKATTPYYRTNEKPTVISIIHKEVNRLIGFEVVQEKENSCVIKDLESASTRSFDDIERRIFFLLMDASAQLVEGASKRNRGLLDTFEEKHDVITKFISYCLRLMNKAGISIQSETAYHYHTIAAIDMLIDTITSAAEDLRNYNKAIHPKTLEVMEAISRHIRLYYELFYKYEKEKVVQINVSRYAIQEKARNLPESVKTPERIVVLSMANVTEVVLLLVEARTGIEYLR